MSEKKLSFDQKVSNLEKILKSLEDSSNLEHNIEQFESGVKLYKECMKYLDKTEKKISVLSESLSESEYEK